MTRRWHAPLDAAQLAGLRARRDDRLVAAHGFEEVREAATASYRTCMITPRVAPGKRFRIVMRLCRRLEAAWGQCTQRNVQSKLEGTQAMNTVIFVLEWSGATRGVGVSLTEEKLRHGSRYSPGTQRLWVAGSLELVTLMAAVVQEVQRLQQTAEDTPEDTPETSAAMGSGDRHETWQQCADAR